MRRKECKLLPHVRQDLFGLDTQSLQFFPWSIKKFNVEKAWNFSQGEEVIVGVIDTGCDLMHEDLKDNLLVGKNFADDEKDPQDHNGHGTHVAGTIAAINNQFGMVGVAPKTKILPVKVLGNDGSGSNAAVANGIMWAVDNGAKILTMSLGSPYQSRNIERALQYAINNNVIVFCAAGNSGNDVDIMYPAKYPETISIGAIGHNLEVSNFSCCGDELDFVAPGEDIISAVPGNQYAKMTGTSMATPYAVGCASLLLSLRQKQHNSNHLKKNSGYIEEFKKVSIPINGRHANEKNYQGNGIILPIVT
jgi:major intracellular serine protease